MAKKTVNNLANKIKKHNKTLYYSLVAIAAIVIIVFSIWAALNPSGLDRLFSGKTNETDTSAPNVPNDVDDYYIGHTFSSLSGNIKFNPAADLTNGLIVHFIDVGQGDAIYIEFPDGRDMLIDGGSVKSSNNPLQTIDGNVIQDKNGRLLSNYIKKYNNDNVIDYLLITHTDKDHYSLLPAVFVDFDINVVYLPYVDIDLFGTSATAEEKAMFDGGLMIDTKGYVEIVKMAISEPNCAVKCTQGNHKVSISDEIDFNMYALEKDDYAKYKLGKDDANELSPICILSYAKRKIVLTGDAEILSENDYLDESPTVNCDVLKVGHHGSASSTSVNFLNDISPEYAIISAGTHETFKHPRLSTLEKFKASQIEYFCTIDCGTIVLKVSDDGNMSFYSARNLNALVA